MQLTSQELKLIQGLRKRERRWPRMRWILLAEALFIIAMYAYMAHYLFNSVDLGPSHGSAPSSIFIFCICWPVVLSMLAIGGALMGITIVRWRGDVNRILLLKLIEAHEKENGKTDKAT